MVYHVPCHPLAVYHVPEAACEPPVCGPRLFAMKPPPFQYIRAESADEAVALLAEHGPEAKLLAGGQSLVPLMSFRLAEPAVVIDIGGLSELRYVERSGGALLIGALTTHRTLERGAELVGAGYEIVSRVAAQIGHYPIRTRGTIGGSIAHADPAAEWCMLALALGAHVRVRGPRGERSVQADDLFDSYYTTTLEPDEMIVEVGIPRRAPHSALAEHARRRGDFALAAACVSLDVVDGECRAARVVGGGVAPTVIRLAEAEAVLTGSRCTEATFAAAARAAGAEVDPPSDLHATSAYRRRLLSVLLRRALHEAHPTTERTRHAAAA
jgi:carbon-monoxide dehydrogenase medium subunit